MTQLNWEEMVRKGIAGDNPGVVTCFVAALDCLLEDQDIPYKVYARYTQAYRNQVKNGVDNRQTRYFYREVLQSAIGKSCFKNFICKRASTKEDFTLILNNALQGKKKIIVFVSYAHVVGLKQVRDGIWKMVGNSLPYNDEITTAELFDYLYVPPCTEKKDDRTNIYLIN